MKEPTWRIDDDDGDPEITGTPRPLFVTGRAAGNALLRTWRTWLGAAIVGALLGVAALFAVPHQASATTTLLMVSPNPGDESAMTTDVSLLMTRKVAERVISELDLEESPETVLSTVTATPASNQILTVTVDGPSEAAAVARARALVDNFLVFRAEQLRSISDGLITGFDNRVSALQEQVDDLTRQYGRISADKPVDQVRLNDVVTARATLGAQIADLQRAIEDASLQTDAAIGATHVIDDPMASPYGSRRQLVLFALSGALLGGAIAVGTILFRALTSDRLRQRREVASALGVPVRVGVGPVPSRRRARRAEVAVTTWIARHLRGHPVRWTEHRRRRNLETLVQGLETALGPRLTAPAQARGQDRARGPAIGRRPGPTTLGVAAIDRADTAAVVIRALADRLAERDIRVLLVDLSASGALAGRATSGLSRGQDDGSGPAVFRPEGDPALAPGPRRSGRRPAAPPEELGELGVVWSEVEVVLALLEVDPGIDLDILGTWVARVVPLVSAGRASRELLTTIAALIEEAGPEIPFALLEGADRTDRTLGHPEPVVEEPATPGKVQSR